MWELKYIMRYKIMQWRKLSNDGEKERKEKTKKSYYLHFDES